MTETARIAADGFLVAADPLLDTLNARAGGRIGAPLAVPAIAAIVRLSRRLRIVVSRAAVVADGADDIDLWVRAEPQGQEIELAVTGWMRRTASPPPFASEPHADADFSRGAADWSWETDAALRVTAVSGNAAGAVGGDVRPFVGAPLTKLFSFVEGADGVLPVLTALAEHRRIDVQLAELRAGEGGRFRLGAVPMTDGRGRFAGFKGTATRLAAVEPDPPEQTGAFAARLDEALRAPLGTIVANAEELGARSDGPLRSEYAAYATDIASAARHLLSLVDDLVDLHAIERPDFAPERDAIDLADIARRAAGLLAVRASGNNVRIDRPAETDRLSATGEFRRVLQILVNLIGNAVRYSPPGGMVWIRVEDGEGAASICVADQGKGIAPEDQARIFGKFERVDATEPGGTGLGLYIARRLARAMGGDITVDSAPGQGARFTLTLPAG